VQRKRAFGNPAPFAFRRCRNPGMDQENCAVSARISVYGPHAGKTAQPRLQATFRRIRCPAYRADPVYRAFLAALDIELELMEYLTPWYRTEDESLAAELRREVCPGHVLLGKSVTVLARRQDLDHVLFALNDGSQRVASVHLTYQKESDPRWPATSLYESLADWVTTMKADHAEYEL